MRSEPWVVLDLLSELFECVSRLFYFFFHFHNALEKLKGVNLGCQGKLLNYEGSFTDAITQFPFSLWFPLGKTYGILMWIYMYDIL